MKKSLSLLACSLLAACAGIGAKQGPVKEGPAATAHLRPTEGSQVHGTTTFTQKGDKVVVRADVAGLMPGLHGFHIHEKGDCSAPDATSAGGHYNPLNADHGGPQGSPRHAGDLGNLNANEYGKATLTLEVQGVSVGSGPNDIIGKGLIVHAKADDFKSQPAGDSGPRVACGVIAQK
jgi:superoxide dismutase, Cu-Zn family